ncbi:MAG: NADH-quinone oxidoreductase subunit C [Dehalococcoidia bacterium]
MAEARRERGPVAASLPPGAQEVIERTSALFGAAIPALPFAAAANATGEVILTVAPTDLLRLCQGAFEHADLLFDHLRFITGVDQMDQGIELVYSLRSYPKRHSVFLKTVLPLSDPHVATVSGIWLGADWHERETAEMFGVFFDGHPDPRHLLLDDDLDIHPLLKAHPLAPIELKQGVNTF